MFQLTSNSFMFCRCDLHPVSSASDTLATEANASVYGIFHKVLIGVPLKIPVIALISHIVIHANSGISSITF